MSIDTDIATALSGIANTQVFPDEAPPETQAPYIVWSRITETPENTMDTATPSIINTRLQVDCYEKTRLAADALAQQVVDALTAPPVKALCLSRQRFTETAVSLKRTVIDFSIWI